MGRKYERIGNRIEQPFMCNYLATMFSNNLLNFFLNTTIINLAGSISYENYSSFICSHLKVSEGSWGKDELVESSEEGSHEGVGLSKVNFTSVVDIELSPGSWEHFGHVRLHL